ncbi:uncharacterized protein ARMOST_10177 [Armillaria ostoyae]|uniref:Uncharacterized protein n=1 Tax=Armillaria ostoyae TaxID=47428 RepID=A0A284RDQ4_ARMOS|nr:uncharacterized protein ARMOST_10177 [Armillaria ostoyae]
MASMAKIEEVTTRLVEKVGKGTVQSLAGDLQALLKEVDEFASINNQVRPGPSWSTASDRRCLAGEVLNLVDELALKEWYSKQVCEGHRHAETASCEALGHAAHSTMQAERLWAALRRDWRAVEVELTCNVCFCLLWDAVTYVSDHALYTIWEH